MTQMTAWFYRAQPLLGTDTAEVSTLTGYIANLAESHGVSPSTILAVISESGALGLRGSICWIRRHGRTVNAYGTLQRRILRELVRLTCRPDLEQTCLGRLAPAFAFNGLGATKRLRHWCPTCFAAAQRSDDSAVDLLAWQVCEISVCIRDFTPLAWRCPHCDQLQDFIPGHGALDSCSECKGTLAVRGIRGPSCGHTTPADAYQRWLCRVVPDLLQERGHLRLSGSECSTFLRALAVSRRVTLELLGPLVQMPPDTLLQWSRQRSKPTLTSWLRFCANLNVSPSLTLADPVAAALQLPLPVPAARIYAPIRQGPAFHHSKKDIRVALQKQLHRDQPTVSSVADFARSINVPIGMVYFHARRQAMALASKLKDLHRKERHKARRNLERRAMRAVAALQHRGEAATRRAVVQLLAKRGGCPVRKGKVAASKALRDRRVDLAATAAPCITAPIPSTKDNASTRSFA